MEKHRREDDQLTARQVARRLSDALGPTGRNEVMKLIDTGELRAEEMRRGEQTYYYVRAADVHDYIAQRLRGREPKQETKAVPGWSREQGIGRDLKDYLPESHTVKTLAADGDVTHEQLVDLRDEINALAAEYRKEGKTEEADELSSINKRVRRLERKARSAED